MSVLTEVDEHLVNDLVHYAVYAQAAYGWPMDLALRWRLHLGGNNQALIRLTGIDRSDVVKAEWSAQAPHRPAYFIVRDHRRQSIVLCIRGTWSAHDLLTDLCCTPQYFETATTSSSDNTNQSFNLLAYAEIFYLRLYNRRPCAHYGMLVAARAVKNDVETIIAKELVDNPGYRLVLVGHSLGGGCAALLGTLFERRFPDLQVYLFGAPCVAPENAKLHRNIVSVVAEGDPFSCLSLGHVADVSTGVARLCEDPHLRNDILLRTNAAGNSMSHSDVEWCIDSLAILRKDMTAEKLFPPGRVLLLSTNKATSTWRHGISWLYYRRRRKGDSQHVNGSQATSKLNEVSIQYFRDLAIGAKMFDLSRHLPSFYVAALKSL
jgi:Lipase (class 3)